MQTRSVSSAICALCLTSGGAVAQEVVWTLDGLQTPESAYLDAGRDVLYVSNIAGEATAKNGNGHISRVGLDGAMLEAEWVTGLDAPKGLVSDGTTLFVSDIDRLVAIDIASGAVTVSYPADGAISVNDTAIDAAGRVYVSDMITKKIHVLEDGALGVLVEGPEVQHPNGLNMRGDQLLVAS